jgi:uracil-DNA glycosylase
MREFLSGWQNDLPAAWREVLGPVSLGFDAISPDLDLEIWEPIFPIRRGQNFPGMPSGTHCLRAFDSPLPQDVRCVILGQDPYPEPGFATGRVFEAGNVADWCELDKMFSKSIRAYTQLIVAARTGDASFAGSFANWPRTLAAIENGSVNIELPGQIADRWVRSGALLLNSSLTLTRFKVNVDPHQALGHLPLWKPLMLAALRVLAARNQPLAILTFGDAANKVLDEAGIVDGSNPNLCIIRRQHPAFADEVLGEPNPFLLCNAFLNDRGETPVDW